MALSEIQSELGGKWKLDSSENFEAFLSALDMSIVFRKIACTAKPDIEVKVEDDGSIKIVSKVSFFNHTMVFKLDCECKQKLEGIEMNYHTTWENKKLITVATPVPGGKGKLQKFVRERVNDELVQTMTVEDVVCKRTFKRVG